jgi:hypothetical protein
MPTPAPHDAAPPEARTTMNSQQLRQAWMAAREEALAAYRWWCDAATDERRFAYAVYVAAADREDAAARDLLGRIDAAPETVVM